MSSGITYNNTSLDIVRVYFVGTTTLRQGQALCWQELAANADKGLGVDVEVPNSDNLAYGAGFVAQSSHGVTGPQWIDMIRPRQGDVISVEVDGTTDVAVGDRLTFQSTSALEGFAKDASPAYTDHPLGRALATSTAASMNLTTVYIEQA
jgi:hypothetical protein